MMDIARPSKAHGLLHAASWKNVYEKIAGAMDEIGFQNAQQIRHLAEATGPRERDANGRALPSLPRRRLKRHDAFEIRLKRVVTEIGRDGDDLPLGAQGPQAGSDLAKENVAARCNRWGEKMSC